MNGLLGEPRHKCAKCGKQRAVYTRGATCAECKGYVAKKPGTDPVDRAVWAQNVAKDERGHYYVSGNRKMRGG